MTLTYAQKVNRWTGELWKRGWRPVRRNEWAHRNHPGTYTVAAARDLEGIR